MKRTALPNRTKPMKRTAIGHNRGGSSFKLSADDKAMWRWLGNYARTPRACDGCGRTARLSRAHLWAKSRGGRVVGNIVLLCEQESVDTVLGTLAIVGCHNLQEKRTDAFIMETGRNLYATARGHTAQWREEAKGG